MNAPLEHHTPSSLAAIAHDLPEHVLSLLASHARATRSPKAALEALRGCGAALAHALGEPSEGAKSDATELALMCAQDSPELVDELSKLLPGFWRRLARHGRILSAMAMACPPTPSGAARARSGALLAAAWLGEGLTPEAWFALALSGGPLWRACLSRSGPHAGESPLGRLRTPAPPTLPWKAAARLRRAFGPFGHGALGHWSETTKRASPSLPERLAVAEGMRALVDEASGGFDLAPGALAYAIGQALHSSEASGAWERMLLRTCARLGEAGLVAKCVVWLDPAFGLAGPAASWAASHLDCRKPLRDAPLPDALAFSSRPALRALGARLGSTPESAGALWSSWRAPLLLRARSHPFLDEASSVASCIEAKALELASPAPPAKDAPRRLRI